MSETPARTYSASELADLTGIATATVSYYVRIGLLPKVPFRGTGTRYTEDHRLRLEAIRRLNPHRLGLPEVRRLLRDASRERLEKLAGRTMAVDPVVVGRYRGRRQLLVHVVNLAPGVDLHISNGADAEAQRVATEIVERYGR
jgi:DNA-binding transcriptional MerR regulator